MVTRESLAPDERSLVRVSAALASGDEDVVRGALATAALDARPVQVEEALLQSYLFLGYPAALGALAQWREVHPASSSRATSDDWREWSQRGAALCRRVYSTRYRELRDNIRRLHPDMERWMVVEGYGKVLSRPGLAPVTREFCIVALLAVSGAGPQLYSHLRGALNLGAPVAALVDTLETAEPFMDDARREAARDTWQRVLSRTEGAGKAGASRSLAAAGGAAAGGASDEGVEGTVGRARRAGR